MIATPTRPRREHRAAGVRLLAVWVLAIGLLAATFMVAGAPAVAARDGARLDADTATGSGSRYCDQPEQARESVRVLTEYTMQRPKRSPRLFVEAYFMRSLIAAHELLQQTDSEAKTLGLDTRTCIARAIAFADTMVLNQNKHGYWAIGYSAMWYADMGAAVGLFPALEPHVDEARLLRYQAAAEKFLLALKRDKVLYPDGSVGMGRLLVIDPLRRPGRTKPEPYLVSTALVGIETRAWLYRRTQRPELRDDALRSLEYTLSQITTDGFLEPAGRREGSIRIAAYVQEGWMAADAFLDDPAVLQRLRDALPVHVEWLLRMQREDGTWDAPEEGSFSRTPAIVTFLMWYDERCQPSPVVQDAVRRASQTLVSRERWDAIGLWKTDDHAEVMRALSGRPLAALARDKFVF